MYKEKGDPFVCISYRAIKLLEQPMKVLERVLELMICSLVRQPHTNKSGFAISAINKYTVGS